jgi:hypothetical protein
LPGDALVLQGTNPANDGSPLYWIETSSNPTGVTVTYNPNPTSGIAPNTDVITIQTASVTPPGTYILTTVWASSLVGAGER